MGFFKEFKEFALRGSVIDLAIGVIIGGAFNKIVNSLVEDIITPLILDPALKAARLDNLSQLVIPGTTVKYGNFLSISLSFIIIAFCLFLIIKGVNKMRKDEDDKKIEPTPTKPSQEELLTEIRDLLKNKKS
ncbi:large conductance mechanosensitive channel protein MscL [Apibacter muscae]|uniref:Large-conductance mechanosensitive channel n=1 Tax=Apibacter muscae TaxID=2509004 RepID=A0A563DGK9_9FLAO|nr:large conductance mechanosensitive channel protein MscL [Apibacter muscae]TWP23707.1 large conductance mechanosensitive channel protein MscL [Apibacter muscae]TWP28993.1 large conductance mechanosensitive channel protein MscL [Apibacter muscae]TWP30425.1 large conductance mechanosensitive channel protein MscL [Apibacter muscae]